MLTKLLCKLIPYKQIGWSEIGEDFIRFQIMKTPWFNLYLHRLWAPNWHPECHDHPWWFVTLLLSGGYQERVGNKYTWRKPFTVLYRPASFSHNVTTGGDVSWSLVLTGPRSREWSHLEC